MPELPEVESFRRLAERIAVTRTIAEVLGADQLPLVHGDPIVLVDEAEDPGALRRALIGRRVVSTHRRGKYAWLCLDDGASLVLHFGMSGQLRAPDQAPLVLSSSPRIPENSFPPRFTKLLIEFSGGGALAFADGRRLGRVWLSTDPAKESPIGRLGFDAFLELPALDDFVHRLARRRGALKGLLLDQSFAAGVGNWIADEVLYRARLDPRREAGSLSRVEARALRRAIQEVLRIAVSVNADSSRFPTTWLFHHRWGKGADATTSNGEKIEFIKVGGRTTAWVPSRQRPRSE
ncbi:MAG: hypothetical protein HYV07_02590 [Deltaproteobacteria bacterium]|nr:hypothetical protein [Deltaproteobacteria bacterium]